MLFARVFSDSKNRIRSCWSSLEKQNRYSLVMDQSRVYNISSRVKPRNKYPQLWNWTFILSAFIGAIMEWRNRRKSAYALVNPNADSTVLEVVFHLLPKLVGKIRRETRNLPSANVWIGFETWKQPSLNIIKIHKFSINGQCSTIQQLNLQNS